jgi:dienelactone hydrolase
MTISGPGAPDYRICAVLRPALMIASLVCSMTLGCASKSGGSLDAAAVKPSADGGYVVNRRYETMSTRDTWTVDGDAVDVSLLVPAPSGAYPLVLYLPGLGELSDAGLSWRQAWARAGYAVLSVQPTKFGPAIWTSNRARAGDFFSIAHDAFSVPSLAARTQIVRDALEQVSRRQHDARATAFARIDLARIAVAGFDLGAQTALMVAGTTVRGVEPPHLPDGVKGVIVLSPYADASEVESNFQPIRLPVLSVTSSLDTDAYGLIGTASIRRVPFRYMPPGQKYLLLLASAPHAELAGARPIGSRDGKDTEDASAAEDDKILGDETAEVYEGERKKRRKPDYSASRADKLAQLVRVQSQVQAVTTAYLDAIIRNDAAAAEWLTKNARAWLGDSGELLSK